jgi:K+-sensing histidine kinase KdpD
VLHGATLTGDADLVSAAVINLLDNAQRHGARQVTLSVPQPGWLCLQDDGSGIDPQSRLALEAVLATQHYESAHGLGLMLADLVARAHGGRLLLPDTAPPGFVVVLDLGLAGSAPTPTTVGPARAR